MRVAPVSFLFLFPRFSHASIAFLPSYPLRFLSPPHLHHAALSVRRERVDPRVAWSNTTATLGKNRNKKNTEIVLVTHPAAYTPPCCTHVPLVKPAVRRKRATRAASKESKSSGACALK